MTFVIILLCALYLLVAGGLYHLLRDDDGEEMPSRWGAFIVASLWPVLVVLVLVYVVMA
jgi:amino acid transporter